MGVKDVITARLLGSTDTFSDKQVAETLELLVAHAVKRQANTVHIEPHDRFVLVRYRIDGALRGVHKLPRTSQTALLKQLKLLAGLKPEDSQTPQEGHYSTEIGGQTVEVRVATMPVLGGEKAVLHVTLQNSAFGDLETLGFWGTSLELVHEALARPHGMITVAGTKHGGKSTTLYSLLQLLNSPAHSIATIEEHATRKLPGASQTYVHARSGTTMLDSLQAVLRQDPNIVMLGNLPTKATAELAVHTAVTGHLVLAELYADSAVSSMLHLRAMGIEPFLLASALRICIGQRLVRHICSECREHYQPEEAELKEIEKHFGLTATNKAKLNQFEQLGKQAGLGADLPMSTTPAGITHLWRAREGGCEHCDRSGYKGRTALVEVLQNSEIIQKQLMKHDMPTVAELHKVALKDGFIPLGLDGLVKALRGQTSVFEVLRSVEHQTI